MVATTVLLIIVLLLGGVFQQASSSWDAGFVRAEGGMDGRRFGLKRPIEVSGSKVTMCRLTDATAGSGVEKVVYQAAGTTVTRTAGGKESVIYERPAGGGNNGAVFSFVEAPAAVSARDYEGEAFKNPSIGVEWTQPSIRVRCTLTREGTFSGLSVRSWGKNGQADADSETRDDIVVE